MSDLLSRMPLEYEPLRNNRFLMRFPSDLGIQEMWVASTSRPTITQNATEIPFINTSTWVVGRYKWESMTITVRDPIGPSASQAIMEWVRLHSESVTGRQGYAVSYKRDLHLSMLDPTGASISQWIIKNAFITSASGGDLSYEDDNLATWTITVQPDYCILSY